MNFNVLTTLQVAALRGVATSQTFPMAKRTRDSLRARGLIEALRESVGVNRGTWTGDMLTPAGRVALGLEVTS